MRTDRHQHRPIAGDSPEAAAVKVLARAHQRVIWDRQRQLNRLRSTLREFFPAALDAFGTDLAHPDALSVLSNRLVGILDGCLRSRSLYDEDKAWGHRSNEPATTATAAA